MFRIKHKQKIICNRITVPIGQLELDGELVEVNLNDNVYKGTVLFHNSSFVTIELKLDD